MGDASPVSDSSGPSQSDLLRDDYVPPNWDVEDDVVGEDSAAPDALAAASDSAGDNGAASSTAPAAHAAAPMDLPPDTSPVLFAEQEALSGVAFKTASVLQRKRGRPSSANEAAWLEILGDGDGSEPMGAVGEGTVAEHGFLSERGVRVAVTVKERKEIVKSTRVDRNSDEPLRKKAVNGYFVPGRTEEALAKAVIGSRRMPEGTLDLDMMEVGAAHLGPETLHMASKRVRSEMLGVSLKKLDRCTPVLAASTCILEQHKRWVFENALAAKLPKKSLVCYIDFCAYDETPMPVTIDKNPIDALTTAPTMPALADKEPGEVLSKPFKVSAPSLAKLFTNRRGQQKVVQCQQEVGYLLSVCGQLLCLKSCTRGHLH